MTFCGRCGQAVTPNGADLPLAVAIAHASQWLVAGEVDRAIAVLAPHVDDSDPDPSATFALGTAYLQRGRYAESLPLLANTVAKRPGQAHAHAYLGMAYLHTYQPAEARAALDLARALAPEDFVVNLKYGELLLRLGYFREAIAPLEQALTTTAPDGTTLECTRRLLRLAREKAPNTFSRAPHRFPSLRRLFRRPARRSQPTHQPGEVVPELG